MDAEPVINSAFNVGWSSLLKIYVPDEGLEAYRTLPFLGVLSDRIFPMSARASA
jgi:hypothetical protein